MRYIRRIYEKVLILKRVNLFMNIRYGRMPMIWGLIFRLSERNWIDIHDNILYEEKATGNTF